MNSCQNGTYRKEIMSMMHTTLNNKYARSPCAFCKLKHCSLTWRQIKSKECLRKQCFHLVKYPNHEIWKQRELTKQKKKAKKTSTVQNYSV